MVQLTQRIQELIECDRISMLAEFDRDRAIPHRATKGSAREEILIRFLRKHLPRRYGVSSGHAITADNDWSNQQDVIIYDAMNSPLVSDASTAGRIVLIESVLATIEVKSSLDAKELRDIGEKGRNIRQLAEKRRPVSRTAARLPAILCLGFAYESRLPIAKINERLRTHTANVDVMCLLRDKKGDAAYFATHQASGIMFLPDDTGEKGPAALTRFLFEIFSHLQSSKGLSLTPDLSKYLNVFGLDQGRRLQSISSAADYQILNTILIRNTAHGTEENLAALETFYGPYGQLEK